MRPYTIVNTVRSQLKWSQHGLRLLRENFPSVLTKTLRGAHCHGSSSHALNQGTKKASRRGKLSLRERGFNYESVIKSKVSSRAEHLLMILEQQAQITVLSLVEHIRLDIKIDHAGNDGHH